MNYEDKPGWVQEAYNQVAELAEVEHLQEKVDVRKNALENVLDAAGADYEPSETNSTVVFLEYGDRKGVIDGSGIYCNVDALLMDRDTGAEELLNPFDETSYGVPKVEKVDDNPQSLVEAVRALEHHFKADYRLIDQDNRDRVERFEKQAKQKMYDSHTIRGPPRTGSSRDIPKLDFKTQEFPYAITDEEIEEMVEVSDVVRLKVDGESVIKNFGRVLEYIDSEQQAETEAGSTIPEQELNGSQSEYFP